MTSDNKRRSSSRSAAELMAELQKKPEYLQSESERAERRRESMESYRAAVVPVLDELATVGFPVQSVGELRRLGRPYRLAVPVLVRWLSRIDNRDVKEDIVRTLSVPWAREAAMPLVTAFRQILDPAETDLRWTIGNALEVLANDEIASELIEVATDRRYGRDREMVVLGLGRLKDQRVPNVLMNLLVDEDVVGHAVMALGKLRIEEARSQIEALLEHPKSWVRKEAKKALAKIEGTR